MAAEDMHFQYYQPGTIDAGEGPSVLPATYRITIAVTMLIVTILTGTEALSGFMLIAWSASCVFVEMLKTWKRGD